MRNLRWIVFYVKTVDKGQVNKYLETVYQVARIRLEFHQSTVFPQNLNW